MWFSPGMVSGAIFILVVHEQTGTASQWWCWLAAIFLVILVDGILGVHEVEVPKVKTKTEYQKD